jgi:hypothetical protein
VQGGGGFDQIGCRPLRQYAGEGSLIGCSVHADVGGAGSGTGIEGPDQRGGCGRERQLGGQPGPEGAPLPQAGDGRRRAGGGHGQDGHRPVAGSLAGYIEEPGGDGHEEGPDDEEKSEEEW